MKGRYATGGFVKGPTLRPGEIAARLSPPCEICVCRYCRKIVIRHLPCSCDRAQEEARRIKGDRR